MTGFRGPLRERWRLAKRNLTPGRAFLLGILLVLTGMALLEHSRVPDLIVRPLMTTNTEGKASAIVVPGAGLTSFCTLNNYSLRRTLLAVRLYRQGHAPVIVFSGGAPAGLDCPIAGVMANLARWIGVPSAAIRIEQESRSTWENALFSAPTLWALQVDRILVVTDRLHMRRAEGVFRHFGFDVARASVPVPESESSNLTMLQMGLREYLALAYYRFRGRLTGSQVTRPDRSSPAIMRNITYPQGPLVILGASYAGGWKVASVAGRPVINRGVSGQQSIELLARMESDVIAERPRAVLLWGFINDVFRAPRAEVAPTLERARRSFEQMAAAARRAGIEPIIATEVTVRPPGSLMETLGATVGRVLGRKGYQDYVNQQVIQTNAWLRDWAHREGLLLLDFERVLANPSGQRRKQYATDDGSHIPEEGYAALTAYAGPLLAERLRPE